MPLRIVVPVDGSQPAKQAVRWAVAFARRTGALLSVCSVVDPMLACIGGAGGASLDPGPMLEMLEAGAAKFCAVAVAAAAAENVASSSAVLEGSPAAAIAAFAGDRRADIIVLGTHARSGLARGILGSVAAEVVQSSRIAVLVVRAETVFGDTGPLVIAVDGSQASTAAARFALSIAAALAVPVHVVHVADFLDDMHGSSALGIVADQAAAAGVACTTEIRHGRVVENLIAAVTEQGASVLVTGTHGRGAFGRLFLGSVAEGLARAATVPVLIVKSAD